MDRLGSADAALDVADPEVRARCQELAAIFAPDGTMELIG
jgi:hypothetical protein